MLRYNNMKNYCVQWMIFYMMWLLWFCLLSWPWKYRRFGVWPFESEEYSCYQWKARAIVSVSTSGLFFFFFGSSRKIEHSKNWRVLKTMTQVTDLNSCWILFLNFIVSTTIDNHIVMYGIHKLVLNLPLRGRERI